MAKFSADRRSDLPLRIIELKESILEDNDKDAQALRDTLHARGTCLLNLMSGPGSGKTSTLLALQPYLEGKLRWGVMEADIDSDVDAKTLLAAGIPAVQLHTGGMCHLDADMTRQGLRALGSADFDLVVLENVGNLVCPAEFDTGAWRNVMLLSVPEGDDKPLKYPLMFKNCQAVLVNKCDTLGVFDDFDCDRVKARILARNPDCSVFFLSARTGEGFDGWLDWLRASLGAFKTGDMMAPKHYDA